MIKEGLPTKFHLPEDINDYPFGALAYYQTFLIQSDYITYKIAEALYSNEELDDDYADALEARKYCRQMINELEAEEE